MFPSIATGGNTSPLPLELNLALAWIVRFGTVSPPTVPTDVSVTYHGPEGFEERRDAGHA
jgi:hypothetical protein